VAKQLSEMLATPEEVVIHGETLRLSPLNMHSWAEFERWCQSRVMRGVIDHLKLIPQHEHGKVIAAAAKEAATITLISDETEQIMASFEGISMLIWLGLHPNHPKLDFVSLQQSLMIEEIPQVLLAFNKLNAQAIGEVKVPNLTAPPQAGHEQPETSTGEVSSAM